MGITSVRALSRAIKNAGTIILNGPAGVFERTDFALGTIEMLNACAEGEGYAVMGGGHTATLVSQRGLATRWDTSQQVAVHVLTCWLVGHCPELLLWKNLPNNSDSQSLSLSTTSESYRLINRQTWCLNNVQFIIL